MAENGPMHSAFYQCLHNWAHLAIRHPLAFVEEVFSFYLRRSSKSLVFNKFNQIDLAKMRPFRLALVWEYELISIQVYFLGTLW